MDESCEISSDPPVTIDIPFGIFSRSDVLDTVKKAVDLVVEAKQEQLEEKEKKLFRDGYDKGLRTAAFMCKSSLQNSENLANLTAVESHGVPQWIVDGLTWKPRPTDQPDPDELVLWQIPPYDDIAFYLLDMRGNRKKLLGTFNGEPLHCSINGNVATHMADEVGFFGECKLVLDGDTWDGYVLGHVYVKGTGLVLSSDGRLFLFNPPNALDPSWPPMENCQGALVEIKDGLITLSMLPNLDIVCFSEV